MVELSYDVVVLGSGPAGGEVASRCRDAGMTVAVVESRGFGGTCPLRGCNPKKVLTGAGEVMARISGLSGKGLTSGTRIHWPDLIGHKKTFTEPVSARVEKGMTERGIDTYPYPGRFVGENRVLSGTTVLVGNRIFIGTGARARKLDIPGEEHVINSEQFLEMKNLPQRIAFLGGGYISFEFAHLCGRAGADVKILQRSSRVLKAFDPDLVDQLLDSVTEIGVQVLTDMPVHAIEREGGGFVVRAGKGGERSFDADLCVHGAGREPDIQDLDLARGKVAMNGKGIAVNAFMQSVSNPIVYAGGDAVSSPLPLTPTATLEGSVAAENIVHGNEKEVDYRGIPSVVFTTPPLAAVGKSEKALVDEEIDFERRFRDTSSSLSSRMVGYRHAGYKLLISKDSSRRILGAHLLGHHAEEMINVFALAMVLDLSLEDLRRATWVYPSAVYDIKHMVEG